MNIYSWYGFIDYCVRSHNKNIYLRVPPMPYNILSHFIRSFKFMFYYISSGKQCCNISFSFLFFSSYFHLSMIAWHCSRSEFIFSFFFCIEVCQTFTFKFEFCIWENYFCWFIHDRINIAMNLRNIMYTRQIFQFTVLFSRFPYPAFLMFKVSGAVSTRCRFDKSFRINHLHEYLEVAMDYC